MATIYYQDDAVTLYHGRCEDVLPTLAAGSVDLVLTDPPYGTTALEWDKPVDWAWWWPAVYRVCRPAALQVLFSAQPFTTDLIVSNRANYRYELIWEKTMAVGFLDANRRPLRAHENIQVFAQQFGGSTYNPQKTPITPMRDHSPRAKPGLKASHYGAHERLYDGSIKTDRHPRSVQKWSNGNDVRSGEHPTEKPLAAVCWLIATYSNPGDVVLDSFGGRGTTAWACKLLGRRCVIIEPEEKYCRVAARGLAQEVMNLAEVAA